MKIERFFNILGWSVVALLWVKCLTVRQTKPPEESKKPPIVKTLKTYTKDYDYYNKHIWPFLFKWECSSDKNCKCVRLTDEFTCFGVSKKSHPEYHNLFVDNLFMKKYRLPAAKDLFYRVYYYDLKIHKVPPVWRLPIADFAVNSGGYNAIKTLQKLLNLTPDGQIGVKTLHTLKANPDKIDAYIKKRIDFISKHRNFKKYGRGWIRRYKASKKGV